MFRAIFFSLFLSVSVFAGAIQRPYFFKCITELPTTSFIVDDDATSIQIRVLHHNGVLYAPFYQRLIVPNDLSIVLDAAEVTKNTGPDFTVKFDKKDCEIKGDELFSCVGEGQSLTSLKKEIKPWHFSRAMTTTKTVRGVFNSYIVTLSYNLNGKSYDVVMDYQPHECRFSELDEQDKTNRLQK